MTIEHLKELHEIQKKSFAELLHQQSSADNAVKLVNINSAANTFYVLLTAMMEDQKCDK